MGGPCLKGFSIVHKGVHGIGGVGAGKFFPICFLSNDHGHRQQVFSGFFIHIQHLKGFCLSFVIGFMQGVAFLPQKF